MKRFNYKAKDGTGKLVTGEVEAMSVSEAAKLVKGRGFFVISITLKIGSPFAILKKFQERVKTGDISIFTRQLSTMINAGLPITEALLILRSQSRGPMQKVVAQILADVEAGESFSTSLEKHPKIFSKTYIALVKSGETGGVMDTVLLRLADNMEKQQEYSGKVKGALVYPAIVIIAMIVMGFLMMIFVIPPLTSMYTDFKVALPLPTQILISTSHFFVNFWYIILAVAGGGFYAFNLYRVTPTGRRKVDELAFKIPVFGDLSRQITLTELTRTLSLMVSSGVPILQALNITSEVVDNSLISDALKDVASQVEKGFPISFSFSRHPEAFPFILTQMIAVGEETGKMDEVLTKISHIFEVESDEKVKGLTAAIEPLVMIVLGIGVGFLGIAIIMPIYSITSAF
jgi:type IV pilus assembly protein PilC